MVAAPLPPPAPRRVSYVLPPPSSPPPLLSLPSSAAPRRGRTNPLFSFSSSNAEHSHHKFAENANAHPRHRLAVQALALDLSTSLSHEGELDSTPGGILYTGGRDGLLCSWELGLPTKRRRRQYGRPSEEEEDGSSADEGASTDEETESGGRREELVGELELDDLGSRNLSPAPRARPSKLPRRRASASSVATTKQLGKEDQVDAVPYEDRYEIDTDALDRLSSPPKAKFRQCIQSHTDWVNDIVLCNYNRTLVSASSDSLVLAWSPHSTNHQDQVTPTPVGRHGDYVRCLATPREGNWVASGGFDRKIKLWDVGEGRSSSVPLLELPSPPASIYSLGTNASGSLIAAGTPERVVRIWDPRSCKQVSRLGGHTDNIRAVHVSEDGNWLLSASSDSTVKLWSIKAQKPLHTFSHHASAVWSLFSQHPSFEIFYSGDRAGNVCKIDLTGTGDPSEGECILLARDGPEDGESKSGQEGITQLVGQDDAFLYTAAGGSSVLRWKDVPTKARRAGALLRRAKESSEGVLADEPLAASPPSQTPPSEFDSAFPSSSERERPSAHSVSFLEGLTAPLGRSSSSPTPRSPANAPHLAPHGRPSSLRTPRQSLVSPVRPPLEHLNSQNPTTLLDIPYDSLIPLTAPEDEYFAPAFQRSNRDPDAATIYSTISNTSARHRPPLVGASSSSFRRVAHSIIDVGPEAIAQRDYYDRESAAEATPLRAVPDDVIEGGYGLRRVELLNDRRHALTEDTEGEVGLWDIVRGRCIGVFAPDELSDAIAERRPSIANSVTSSGSSGSFSGDLLEYVRERIEGEVSVAVWCKCDTRVGSLTVHLEPARVFDAEAYIDEVGLVGPLEEYPADHRISLGKWALRQLFDGFVEAEMSLRVPDSRPPPPPPSALFGTAPVSDELFSLTAPQPRAKPARTLGMTISLATPAVKKAVLPSLPPSSPRFGNSELQTIPQSPMLTGPLTPRAGGNTPTMERQEGDYFSSRSPSIEQANSVPLLSPSAAPTPLPGGSGTLMGRLKFLGKGTKKPNSMADTPAAATPVAPLEITDGRSIEEQQQQLILDTVFSQPLMPCPLIEAPHIDFDPNMAVIISEENGDACWTVKYRGLVGTSCEDMSVLEQKAPFWLLDFLLGNRTSVKELPKVSFILQPWKDVENSGRLLPELPNANARLTASRSLRVRKVAVYVADKLDLRRPSRAPSIIDGASDLSSTDSSPAVGNSLYGEINPEVEIEILVNGEVLSPTTTLATIRHCMWKGGGDVVLSYRWLNGDNTPEI